MPAAVGRGKALHMRCSDLASGMLVGYAKSYTHPVADSEVRLLEMILLIKILFVLTIAQANVENPTQKKLELNEIKF